MTAEVPEGIRADLARWSLGRIGLAQARSERAHVKRTANTDRERNLVFHVQRRGRLTMIHGDTIVPGRVGDILIADDRRPYALDISERNDCLILQLPAALFEAAQPAVDWHGRTLCGQDPNVAFLKHMLEGLWCERDLFDQIEEGIDEVVATAARIACRRSGHSAESETGLPSPVEYALRNLHDPMLSTATIAAATGLCTRAIQKSFAREAAATPTAFITERRLARAAELLVRDRERNITDAAFAVGFSDSAFFSRCFRRRYGVSPSEWRSRADN